MNKDISGHILGADDKSYLIYFHRHPSSLLWVKCRIPEEIIGGPYWDGNYYSIPIKVEDYKINKESPKTEGANIKTRMEVLALSIEKCEGVILNQNLNLKKRDFFELLLDEFYGERVIMPGEIRKLIIIPYKF